MRLSRLNIAGFKSFPDRAELGFDQGITAIVGPNGCGKSNVVDAITWVLGEQSAKSLRGERMEDVIFNGSDARKPTATAEVRLRLRDVAQRATAASELDPAAFEAPPVVTRDVEIGRRLYRSGESEYLVDGEVCRLRDVHDLLMDSGLGIKAYAVIEQGKIGQILSSRPAERRALIEEAAGVTKYKARRRTAELKLEAAQQNLTRVDDIIFEVEKQRGALRRQASRARRYKRLREELRRWEQVQFARRHASLMTEIEAAEQQLTAAKDRETAAGAHVASLETELEALRLALTEAEAGATEARELAHARELEIGRIQQQIQFDKQQIDELGGRSRELSAEVADLEGRRDPARLAMETQREAARRARQALDDAGQRVAECSEEYARAVQAVQTAEHDADETRAAVLAATTTLSALRQVRDHAAAARDRVAAERERLDIEGRELRADVERAGRDRDAARTALSDARTRLDQVGHARTEAELDLTRRRATRDALAEALAAGQHDLATLEGRLRSLEELDASRATFGDGAQFLLGEESLATGRRGAVADYLEVERSYERAVDALLGDLLQYVVVDGKSELSSALALAGARNAGRCGLVVLEELLGRPAIVAAENTPAGARTLRSVVRLGDHGALAHLIPDALIVDDLPSALRLARQSGRPVATLSGEVVRDAGVVEGGSRRDARGILETRGEVINLREAVAARRAANQALASEAVMRDDAIASAAAELAAHVSGQHQEEKTIVGLEAQLVRVEDEFARLSRRLDVVSTEQRRACEEEQTAEHRREEAATAITLQETHQRGAEHKLGDVMAVLQTSRGEAEDRNRRLTEARAAQAGLVERASALDTDVIRLDEAARELEERIAGRQAEIARHAARRDELRQGILEAERRLDDDVRSLEETRTQVRTLDECVFDLRAGFNVKEHDIRTARQAFEHVRSEVLQSEVARAKATSDLDHLASLCQEAVSLSIDEVVVAVAKMEEAGELVAPAKRLDAASAGEEEDEADGGEVAAEGVAAAVAGRDGAATEDAPASAEEPASADPAAPVNPEAIIADLRRKLERLGPVNMMAIEQFDELETRHAFLTTQRKDLLDAISQTGEAIRKIDKTTRERFAEAFEVINRHFEGTFTTLFGGGRAGLVLIDQENDEESGIDIVSQPPGKRLQNVQLLSGGEKALTAMALMFAIFKYRPSPFCLLDEIDAPLDDANVGRFVDMLAGMQEHTQFILITHNRKTMEIADRLYGVTMEEPGVSKLISVQLN